MSQSKKKSLLESVVNTLLGFAITFICSPFIYWLCNVKVNYVDITWLTLAFTVLSILRNYVIRRFFNKQEKKEEII